MNFFVLVYISVVIFADVCSGFSIRKKRHFWSNASEDFHPHPQFRFNSYEPDQKRPNLNWPHSEFFHSNHGFPTQNHNEDSHESSEFPHHSEHHFHKWHKRDYSDEWNEHNHSSKKRTRITSACTTPTNKSGLCKPVKNCSSILKLMENNNLSKDDFRKFKCNNTHIFEVQVCCPSIDDNFIEETKTDFNGNETNNDQFKNTTKTINDKINDNSVLKSLNNICGTQETPGNKITGGTSTDLEEFPWMALLQYAGRNGLTYGCGGTLISDRFVLTAGHCVDQDILKQKFLEKLFRVVLGEYDMRNETDCIYLKYGTNCADPPKYCNVERTILHDLYESKAPSANDIALVKLETKVIYTDFIRPICLPSKSTGASKEGNDRLVISGWGRTETEIMSHVKRKASLRMTSDNQCNTNLQENLKEGQICLSGENGQDSCNGDSGGPVMLEKQNESGKIVFTVLGIISFGFRPCGTFPSVATNVSKYLDWIQDQVRTNS